MGPAAHGDALGILGPLEEGAAFRPESLEVSSSLAQLVAAVGMDWFAIPHGWSVYLVNSRDVLLYPSESGFLSQVPDVALRHGECPTRGVSWFYWPAVLVGTSSGLRCPSGQ